MARSYDFVLSILMLAQLSHSFLGSQAIDQLLTQLDAKHPSALLQESAAKAVLERLLPTHL